MAFNTCSSTLSFVKENNQDKLSNLIITYKYEFASQGTQAMYLNPSLWYHEGILPI